MQRSRSIVLAGLLSVAAIQTGCEPAPPPPRVPVPQSDRAMYREREIGKPMPAPRVGELGAPPFDDQPLVNQQLPEAPRFVDAYRRVGQPKITLFVNRGFEGTMIPVNETSPLARVEVTRSANAGVTIDQRETVTSGNYHREVTRDTNDSFKSTGPVEYREAASVYLRPGQYDDVNAKALDYLAVENVMTDWLSADGQITLVSPALARQRLSDQTVKEMESGRPQVLSEVAQQLGADVLIQVQARPTRQTFQGLEVRILAEAMNTRDGQSIGRAFVDVPPPLDKVQINKYTRFLARKLMDGMASTWSVPQPPALRGDGEPPRAPTPTGSLTPPAAPAPATLVPPPAPPAPPIPPAANTPPAPTIVPPPPPAPVAPPAPPVVPPAPPSTQP